MNRNSFKAFGVVTLVLSPLVFPITVFHTMSPASTLIVRGLVSLLVTGLVGCGLICLRKWAALYFSLPLFAYGILEAFFSIEEVTFPLNLLVMLHGLSLTLPLVVTIRVWKHLTWGRRFF
jgi:hypothetical protein